MNAPQIKTMLANPAKESHERLYVPGDACGGAGWIVGPEVLHSIEWPCICPHAYPVENRLGLRLARALV
jgi:hypothetical protein